VITFGQLVPLLLLCFLTPGLPPGVFRPFGVTPKVIKANTELHLFPHALNGLQPIIVHGMAILRVFVDVCALVVKMNAIAVVVVHRGEPPIIAVAEVIGGDLQAEALHRFDQHIGLDLITLEIG